jgi:hypothetical protein
MLYLDGTSLTCSMNCPIPVFVMPRPPNTYKREWAHSLNEELVRDSPARHLSQSLEQFVWNAFSTKQLVWESDDAKIRHEELLGHTPCEFGSLLLIWLECQGRDKWICREKLKKKDRTILFIWCVMFSSQFCTLSTRHTWTPACFESQLENLKVYQMLCVD